jgi:hypothetical protein
MTITTTSEKTRTTAVAFLEAVALAYVRSSRAMPESVIDAGLALMEALADDEKAAEEMRATVQHMVEELEGEEPTSVEIEFDLEDTHAPMRFNLKKRPLAELDS